MVADVELQVELLPFSWQSYWAEADLADGTRSWNYR